MELLQSMRLFARLAELQSFTKVAEALQMGHPQVTLAINQLEASLGVRLFQRTTRKVSLTAEGEAFLVRVAGIPGEVDEAVTTFGAPGDMALLSKSSEGRADAVCNQFYNTGTVTGVPSRVKRLSTAARICNSAT
ncbi:LysR family transcriptional regulator [Massilia varians]